MSTCPKQTATIALVDDKGARGHRLERAFRSDPRFSDVVSHRTLKAAFVAIEMAPPDVVVVSSGFLECDEYPMFEALLDMLEVKRVYVGIDLQDMPSALLGCSEDVPIFVDAVARRLKLRPPEPAATARPAVSEEPRLVVIGSSTGGIEALETVLSAFPVDCPPTLIVQHIKPNFVTSLVARLGRACAATVSAARPDAVAMPGQVLVAPGSDAHLVLRPRGRRCAFVEDAPFSGHRPSVDRLFLSAASYGDRVIGVLLTGMGRDGAEGLRQIRQAGGWTIGQDAATSVVYGMPQAAKALGAVNEELPLGRIGRAILNAASREKATAP